MVCGKRMEQSRNISAATWEACKAGDKAAYATIYTAYYPRLFNYGKKFTRDEQSIEDSIQEIFTAFWFSRQKLNMVREVPAYLLTCFRNHLLNTISKNRVTSSADFETESGSFNLEMSVDQVMINAERIYEQSINLRESLEKLTPHQKEALFLRFYENLSYDQIAGIFGISVKATYKLMARAVSELRSVYKLKLASTILSLVGCFCQFC
ncbi:MAG: sigma-70 family RNA polymerase sigma factor [Chitinophagaceae bacterium]|nr:MAG: sigma-70 family RNA polymerase sigma factor [Chitinophagaceae bacterium]